MSLIEEMIFLVQWYNSTIIFKDTPIQIENIIHMLYVGRKCCKKHQGNSMGKYVGWNFNYRQRTITLSNGGGVLPPPLFSFITDRRWVPVLGSRQYKTRALNQGGGFTKQKELPPLSRFLSNWYMLTSVQQRSCVRIYWIKFIDNLLSKNPNLLSFKRKDAKSQSVFRSC